MSIAASPTAIPAAASSPSFRARMPWLLLAVFGVAFAAIGFADVPFFMRFLWRAASMGLWLLLFLGWWMANRRVPLGDRFAVLGGMLAVLLVIAVLMHPSVRMLAIAVAFYAVPAQLVGWTLWLMATRHASAPARRNGMIAIVAIAWAWTLLVRFDGLLGQGDAAFHWRWTPTGEEQFLAARQASAKRPQDDVTPLVADEPLVATDADWPSFRGPLRDGAVRGITIRTDWNESPPKQRWKRRVGPGWSSIVIVGNRLFTQEQRDANEAVVCFDADTGEEVWGHEDAGRFDEAMGGVGPRATPAFADGRLYALGAKGLLNCLDAATGKPIWSRDISNDGQQKVPMWGFCSSPLVVDGKVIVFAGGGGDYSNESASKKSRGEDEAAADKTSHQDVEGNGDDKPAPNVKTLLAYDAETGELAWQAASGSHSYSSPQLATFDGMEQILFLSDASLVSVEPATGEVLWTHPTTAKQSMPSLQPQLLGGAELIASFGSDAGIFRIAVSHSENGWQVNDAWARRDVKPFFNDFVRSGGALYGFNGKVFCCVDANTGKQNWKKGRYGSGQVLLVADQPVLVVISESGEAVLVAANPQKHEELGRFQAIEGKTWNHPTIVRGRLYVRNAEEMACYEL